MQEELKKKMNRCMTLNRLNNNKATKMRKKNRETEKKQKEEGEK